MTMSAPVAAMPTTTAGRPVTGRVSLTGVVSGADVSTGGVLDVVDRPGVADRLGDGPVLADCDGLAGGETLGDFDGHRH